MECDEAVGAEAPIWGLDSFCPLAPLPPSLSAQGGTLDLQTSAMPVCELVQPQILWLSPYR